MTPQTFSEWWKSLEERTLNDLYLVPDKGLVQFGWNSCEASRPTFETLVAQLGQAEKQVMEMRVALIDCEVVLAAVECGMNRPLATGFALAKVRALLRSERERGRL